jgi:hypothetical protein
MPDFRAYIVDPGGHVLFRTEIVAADLDAAKRDAYDLLHSKRACSVLPVHGIELWQGTERLFSNRTVVEPD